MFSGIFISRVDGNRIIIPSLIRKVIHAGKYELLAVLTHPNSIGSFPVVPLENLTREVNGFIVSMDTKGRIVLPKALLHQLQEEDTKTVMLVGLGRYLELWSPRRLEERQMHESEDFRGNEREE